MKFGPTKVEVKGDALYDAKTGKLIQGGLTTRKELEDYAAHHYITLPVVDNAGKPWLLDGKHVYCLRGSKFETLDVEAAQLRRSEEHTSELQSQSNLVCRLLLEKKNETIARSSH